MYFKGNRSHISTRLFRIILLCIILVQICYSLYEDQIGKFDWRQQFIGKIKYSYIDPYVAGVHKFHVATEENVLACISTRTGSIIWRQVFEKGEDGIIDALSEEGDIITVSGNGQFIRSWDPNTGVLLWETSFPTVKPKIPNSDMLFYINSEQNEVIMVEIEPKSHAKISVYSFTRASMKTSDLIKAHSIDPQDCKFLSSHYFLCVDDKESLKLLSLKDVGAFITVPLKNFGIDISKDLKVLKIHSLPHQKASSKPYFALQLDNDFILFQMQPPGIKLKKIYPNVHRMTSTIVNNELVVFSLVPSKGSFIVLATNPETDEKINALEGSLSIPSENGDLEGFFVLPYVKKDHGTSYKLLLSTSDHAILLIHQQSRIIWSREEALAKIVSVEILELPLSETDANIEQEFGDINAGILTMLYNRLKSQMFLMESFFYQSIAEFQHGAAGFIGKDREPLARDTFGLHKIIVAITMPGKVFGIDNLSGQIVWSHYEVELDPYVANDHPFYSFYVQRTTAHFPYPPQCTILGRHQNSDNTHLYSFNPITGTTIDSKVLPYVVLQASFMGVTDIHHLRGILLLGQDYKVYTYPETALPLLYEHRNIHYIVSANSTSGLLTGYSLGASDGQSIQTSRVWKVQLPNSILCVTMKRPFEHVHSQGRVMGDRSVLYKYLNPNLAVVFNEGHDPKSNCEVHLVDVITGLIVYSTSHKKCRHPIQVVHSENWVVYSYYNDKSRRLEVSSIELFEGISQSNTTAFSSFAPPPLPLVEHQSFIFPSQIEAMIDTVTERGMTNKHILIALPNGGILELPKAFLDPRRPINPTPEHREEGLIPYIPELPIISDRIINYNKSVMRIHGIQTAPSGLESTCLVFAYGLDLFYTRVTPSKTFDILKDDFDHYLISAVLLGLLLLSYTTKKLAARKSLKAAWK